MMRYCPGCECEMPGGPPYPPHTDDCSYWNEVKANMYRPFRPAPPTLEQRVTILERQVAALLAESQSGTTRDSGALQDPRPSRFRSQVKDSST